jgi:hypothetical protein
MQTHYNIRMDFYICLGVLVYDIKIFSAATVDY